MQMIPNSSTVWQTAAGNFNRLRPGGYAAFLTWDQQVRLERIRQARMLRDDQHREYFLGEGRTQHDFPEVQTATEIIRPYVAANLLGLISETTADMLFGEDPIIRVDDEIQQAKLTALVEATSLADLLHDLAEDCSAEGEAFIEAVIHDGQVYLTSVPAETIFPEGGILPDGQYASYVRYAIQNWGTPERPIWLLLETRHLAGAITHSLWQLDERGMRMPEPLDLVNWKTPNGRVLRPVVRTGIVSNTITWIPNRLRAGRVVSDYDRLLQLQDLVNAKYTQLARVIGIHADPAMYFPTDLRDDDGHIRSRYKAFFVQSKDQAPGYITWESQLDAALRDRGAAVQMLLIRARMSPALLGLKEGAAPDAWKKLRLEAANTLSMIKGKARRWAPRVRRALAVAQELQQTLPGERFERYPIAVEVRDGIPIDDKEQAETIATLRGAGAMSLERAIRLQLVDEAATAEEVMRLQDESQRRAEEMTPSILMGETNEVGQDEEE